MDATPDPQPAVALPPTVRSMGAMLGALLGLGAMGLLYIASTLPAVESLVHTHDILGSDGIAAAGGTRLLAWAVAPVAAAIAGWISAPRALVGRRHAGVRMGFLTYGIAILIAPLLVLGPSLTGADVLDGLAADPVESLASVVSNGPSVIVFVIGFGSVILWPLLVVCAGAGAVWAEAVRWVTRGSVDPGPRPDIPETDTRLLLAVAVLLGSFWLLFAVVTLGGPWFGGGFAD